MQRLSCKKNQPMAFRCRSCGAELMRRAGSGRPAASDNPVPPPPASMAMPDAGGAGAATMDNPYAAPQMAAAVVTDHLMVDSQELASRGSRLAASLLDSAIPLFGVFLMALGVGVAGPDSSMSDLFMFVLAIAAIGFVIYQIRLLVTQGQTLGKKIMNIRIVSYDDGMIPGAGKLLGLRYVVNGLLGQIPGYAFVDVLFIFGQEQRCIHDYLAGTKVVQA